MTKARFPPLSNQPLRRVQQIPLRLKTCAGSIEIQTHYGQDAQTKQWFCPMRHRWHLTPRQAMSSLLEDRLCFTATLAGSYEAAAQLAEKWGARKLRRKQPGRFRMNLTWLS